MYMGQLTFEELISIPTIRNRYELLPDLTEYERYQLTSSFACSAEAIGLWLHVELREKEWYEPGNPIGYSRRWVDHRDVMEVIRRQEAGEEV